MLSVNDSIWSVSFNICMISDQLRLPSFLEWIASFIKKSKQFIQWYSEWRGSHWHWCSVNGPCIQFCMGTSPTSVHSHHQGQMSWHLLRIDEKFNDLRKVCNFWNIVLKVWWVVASIWMGSWVNCVKQALAFRCIVHWRQSCPIAIKSTKLSLQGSHSDWKTLKTWKNRKAI